MLGPRDVLFWVRIGVSRGRATTSRGRYPRWPGFAWRLRTQRCAPATITLPRSAPRARPRLDSAPRSARAGNRPLVFRTKRASSDSVASRQRHRSGLERLRERHRQPIPAHPQKELTRPIQRNAAQRLTLQARLAARSALDPPEAVEQPHGRLPKRSAEGPNRLARSAGLGAPITLARIQATR